jgi:hypothetical protein
MDVQASRADRGGEGLAVRQQPNERGKKKTSYWLHAGNNLPAREQDGRAGIHAGKANSQRPRHAISR